MSRFCGNTMFSATSILQHCHHFPCGSSAVQNSCINLSFDNRPGSGICPLTPALGAAAHLQGGSLRAHRPHSGDFATASSIPAQVQRYVAGVLWPCTLTMRTVDVSEVQVKTNTRSCAHPTISLGTSDGSPRGIRDDY